MRLYFERAGRYMLKMIILLTVLLVAMAATKTSVVSGSEMAALLLQTWRGWFVLGLLVVFTAMYPKITFGSVDVKANLDENKEAVINAFATMNFRLVSQSEGRMVFCPKSGLRRMLNAWNDAVTVEQERYGINIEGMKKDILKVESRIRLYLNR